MARSMAERATFRRKAAAAPFGPEELERLRQSSLEDLRGQWLHLFRNPAPRSLRRELLIRAIAYQRQVELHGGLSGRTRKLLLKIATLSETTGFTSTDLPRRLAPGTRLVRAWRGTTHTVDVLADGFSWNGERYTSLSTIAKTITGTSWNGNAFFGLKPRKSKSRAAAGEAHASPLPTPQRDAEEMADV